jgi:acyl-CoA synthetase (AMP-forming)/AMP-acid ligase II
MDMDGSFSLGRVFAVIADALGDQDCIVAGSCRRSYREVADRATRLASFLHDQGLGIRTERVGLAGHQSGQDTLALALYNGSEYLEGMVGSYGARVAPFNVNYRYIGEELRYLLQDAAPAGIIFHSSYAPVLAPVLETLPGMAVLLQVADETGHDLVPGAVDYEEAIASASTTRPPVEPSGEDLYVLYTGGTTGMPKGVLWRQHDIYIAAMGGRSLGTWNQVESYKEVAAKAVEERGLKLLMLPPLMHGAAQWSSFVGFGAGATIVFPTDPRRFDQEDILGTIEREKVNVVATVGDAMLRPLLDEAEHGHYDLASLTSVVNGGAPLSAPLRDRLHHVLPHVVIADAAGSSETGAQMVQASAGEAGKAGLFTPGPGAVVVSESLDGVLEPGHEDPGWLAQSGHIPLGYLNDPAKTAKTFPVVDGVRYSIPGDRARMLEDGQIELLGRDAVTINSGGEKIFAEEVEGAIAGHPAVMDVVVAGRESDRWGQEVVAIVALREGMSAKPEEIIQYASSFIARYKLPKKVVFVESVQRFPSGKADYRWARERARKQD